VEPPPWPFIFSLLYVLSQWLLANELKGREGGSNAVGYVVRVSGSACSSTKNDSVAAERMRQKARFADQAANASRQRMKTHDRGIDISPLPTPQYTQQQPQLLACTGRPQMLRRCALGPAKKGEVARVDVVWRARCPKRSAHAPK